jgi:hypothetical protein
MEQTKYICAPIDRANVTDFVPSPINSEKRPQPVQQHSTRPKLAGKASDVQSPEYVTPVEAEDFVTLSLEGLRISGSTKTKSAKFIISRYATVPVLNQMLIERGD